MPDEIVDEVEDQVLDGRRRDPAAAQCRKERVMQEERASRARHRREGRRNIISLGIPRRVAAYDLEEILSPQRKEGARVAASDRMRDAVRFVPGEEEHVVRIGDHRVTARRLREESGVNKEDDVAVGVFFRAARAMEQRAVHVSHDDTCRSIENLGHLPAAVQHGWR